MYLTNETLVLVLVTNGLVVTFLAVKFVVDVIRGAGDK